MKRFISCLLAGILMLTLCLPASAGSVSSLDAQTDPNAAEIAEDLEPPEITEDLESVEQAKLADHLGQIDLSVIAGLEMKGDVTFTATLDSSLIEEMEQTLTLEADKGGMDPSRAEARFEHLPAGEYTLTVNALGFKKYEQVIDVENHNAYGLELIAGGAVENLEKKNYYTEKAHPGFIRIGDVNEDGKIDEQDKEKLIRAIDERIGTGDNELDPREDLNRDGKVDLADLEYFTKGWQELPPEYAGYATASLKIAVPEAAISASLSANTVEAEGSLQALLQNKGSVKLANATGSEITENSPVNVAFDLTKINNQPTMVAGIVIEDPIVNSNGEKDNSIQKAGFDIIYEEEGKEKLLSVPFEEGVNYLLENENVKAVRQGANGAICISFGSQVAVKRVILKIFGTSSNNLAEISKVEFLGDMESRIPEPDLSIPENLKATAGSRTFTLTWDPCQNVTGYEVVVADEALSKQDTFSATGNTLEVNGISWGEKGKLENNTEYTVKVRSVNGTWRSPYCEPIKVTPKATAKPDRPDYVKATGQYKSIAVSWGKAKDADTYTVYYKEDDASVTEYAKVGNITGTSYTISGLKDKTSYLVYVTASNEIGESVKSETAKAETTNMNPAKMPKYKRINEAEEGQVSTAIKSATVAGGGEMIESPLDTGSATIWGTVDNNPKSYYRISSWDLGGFNGKGSNGLVYEFDQPYKMQYMAMQWAEAEPTDYFYKHITYWDENNVKQTASYSSFGQRKDDNGKIYYWVRFSQPITATKIMIGLARYMHYEEYRLITVSEVNFYHYDSLEDDIMGLYQDDLHTVLRSNVTQTTIDGLRTRLNTVDEVSGEYHPEKASLEKELKTAEEILNGTLSESIRVHGGITTRDTNLGFGGLNAWQPLGITAAANEKITVYVGHKSKKTGEGTELQLVATQYHAESSPMFKVIETLKIGRNDITLPQLQSLNAESGGALYVRYTGNATTEQQYAVRVSGGMQVPILDLYQVTDRNERLKRAEAYVKELETYVGQMQAKHNEIHQNSQLASVKYNYDEANCILGASDILLDTMMLSLPAQQILAGSGSGTAQQKAEKIVTSMDAMEEMMHLFYQHKGLNKTDSTVTDAKAKFPRRHLNIRYQRMFTGAFMYASGNHIGIEYGSTSGMITGVPVQKDENGKWTGGRYFGWGIAHEIGHCINQGTYAVAEVTNNYFSVLAQARDTNDSVRFDYNNVYKKVTSNTKGPDSNVFTQLGMYWQLHLAYDNGYNYKTYDNYNDQLNNLFFARVDTYARDTNKAPAPGGVALALGNTDQSLMRLSCAAAEKNLLEFFERWGMTPDADTIAYAEQFDKETRAIYYGNDNSRVYRLTHTTGATPSVGDGTTATVDATKKNQVNFTLAPSAASDNIHGYEIVRCMTSGGKVEKQVVGFTTGTTFTDHVTTINNRVLTYEITLIDQNMNRSAAKTLQPLKIEHKGNIDKTNWNIVANKLTTTQKAETTDADDDIPCAPITKAPITKAIDNDNATEYVGTVQENAEVLLEFNQPLTITALQYTPGSSAQPIGKYSISVLTEKGEWTQAAEGTFDQNKQQTVYFTTADQVKGNIAAYKATAVKLFLKDTGSEISIAELDLLGVTGDNVDFRTTQESSRPAIGKLTKDFIYGSEAEDFIPAGSIVFNGSYKGNPAYNVVLLYDQDGNNVGGFDPADGSLNAAQIVLADVPEGGLIQNVSDGDWLYWVEPNTDLSKVKQVRAELYRVDDAKTLAGQRLVSDSLFVDMPASIPDMTLENIKIPSKE